MGSVLCRNRKVELNCQPFQHFKNYSSKFEDGKLVVTPVLPVAPSLASEYSVALNALKNSPTHSSKRLNVDALDLEIELSKLS